ncbi:hypothetical protein WALSEDRAFT_61018 [Wallemia mellicola CBS 633.66]|uniref:Arrestin C-terminal-like domain-containing protein n=1 Tax=Wallemia mellicola (strain ATCC MYA-4683 / CBS 633.66) TaxID=671144 RepID=I4Y8R9_WALMC|nr:hypothetical protein WALSEDRAFT_61018 [Wallemia mellicola CBS 633.66]EIM20361.1 hypothetical protein WALSEDRAFT_61018 [Wallemia mellicola CBS 633.66]|eukprot:XP_006959618.1 hypothetical protein WALSEDRAFT_61018 [Wallemia mellicola CBS 633.66]
MAPIWSNLSRSSSRTDVPSLSSSLPSNVPTPTRRPSADAQGPSKIEIEPEHETVVLRGLPGDSTPFVLRGAVKLHLSHSTEFKDITIQISGKCRTNLQDRHRTSTVNDTHILIDEKKSVMTKAGKHHQTLGAGRHTFQFEFDLHSELPASFQLVSGAASIKYKLKAHAYRPQIIHKDLYNSLPITLLHGLPSEALEFSQTLDIENTWPKKIMYAITLPHKVFAAGESIPISIKFTPLTKGVKVTQLTTIVKEYAETQGKFNKQEDNRMVTTARHQFSPDGEPIPVEMPLFSKRTDTNAMSSPGTRSVPTSPAARPQSNSNLESVRSLDLSNPSSTGESNENPSWRRPLRRAMVGWSDNDPRLAEGPEDLTELNDGEVDSVINVDIPATAVPTHQFWPVQVYHKIKWSCMIQNRDGHQSELRCALPIHILSNRLLQENVIATANARRALFGQSAGAANPQTADEAATAAATADLPSYSNHIYDRVPNANVVTSGTIPSGYGNHTYSPLGGSPAPMSPSDSRPTTPGVPIQGSNRGSSGIATPPDQLIGSSPSSPTNGRTLPTRPQMSWADSEFYMSLGEIARAQSRNASNQQQQAANTRSPGSSRNNSRMGSRQHSRASSRAGSPERGFRNGDLLPQRRGSDRDRRSSEQDISQAISLNDDDDVQPPPPSEAKEKPTRPSFSSSHSLNNLFSGHSSHKLSKSVPKALKPLTSFKSHGHSASSSKIHQQSPLANTSPDNGNEDDDDDVSALNRVPSYDVASRGFLGGGVVPLPEGLPTYDESQTNMQRSSTLDAGSMRKLRQAAANENIVSGNTQNQSLTESLSHMNLGQQGNSAGSEGMVSRRPSRASATSSSSRRPQVKFTLEHDSEDEEGGS